MTALITADEYATLLNETLDGLPGAYVDGVLATASADAEAWTGRGFSLQSRTALVDGKLASYHGQEVLKLTLPYVPVAALTSVEVWYTLTSGEPTALDVTDAFSDSDQGLLYVPFGRFGTWQTFFTSGRAYKTRVVYTAGTGDPLPTDVKRAVALLAQELFAADADASRTQGGAVTAYSVAGEYSEARQLGDRSASGGLGLGTRLAIAAQGVLTRYRRSGAVFI